MSNPVFYLRRFELFRVSEFEFRISRSMGRVYIMRTVGFHYGVRLIFQ